MLYFRVSFTEERKRKGIYEKKRSYNVYDMYEVEYTYTHEENEFRIFEDGRPIVHELHSSFWEVDHFDRLNDNANRVVVACHVDGKCSYGGPTWTSTYFVSIPLRSNSRLMPKLYDVFGEKRIGMHRDLTIRDVVSRTKEVKGTTKRWGRKMKKVRRTKDAVEEPCLDSVLAEHEEILLTQGDLHKKKHINPRGDKNRLLLRELKKSGLKQKARRWFDRYRQKPAGRWDTPECAALKEQLVEEEKLEAAFGKLQRAKPPKRDDVLEYRDDSVQSTTYKKITPENVAPDKTDEVSSISESEMEKTVDQIEHLVIAQDGIKDAIDKCGLVSSKDYERTAHKLERLILFGMKLTASQSYSSFLYIIVDFLHEMSEKSWVETVLKFARSLMSDTTDQAPASWTEVVAGLTSNTYLFKVFKLVAMAISIVLAGFSNVEWDLEIFKETDFTNIKISSIWSMITESMDWFVKVGHEAFRTKSILPLFWTSPGFASHMKNYENIVERYEKGKLSRDPVDWHSLYADTIKCKEQISNFVKTMKADASRTQLTRYVSLLAIKEYEIAERLQNTGPRIAPFGVCVNGASGVGKSANLKFFLRAALKGYDEDLDEGRVWNINAGAAHDDGLKNDTNVAILDDFGNNHPDFQQTSPTDRIITITNNVRYLAKMADVESKGKISPIFKTLLVTTNVKHLNAKVYSMCPSSILRRMLHVEMVVNEEFCIPGSTMLDADNADISDVHPKGHPREGKPKKNIHRYLVQHFIPRVPENTSGYQTIDYRALTGDTPERDDGYLYLDEMEKAIVLLSRKKYQGQLRLMEQNSNLPRLEIKNFVSDQNPAGLLSMIGCVAKPLSIGDTVDTLTLNAGRKVMQIGYEHFFPTALKDTQAEVIAVASATIDDTLEATVNSSELWLYRNLPREFFINADGKRTILGKLIRRTHMRRILLRAIYKAFSPTTISLIAAALILGRRRKHRVVGHVIAAILGAKCVTQMIARARHAYNHYENVKREIDVRPTNITNRLIQANVVNSVTVGVSLVIGLIGAYKLWALAHKPAADEPDAMPTWLGSIWRSARGPSPSYTNMPGHQFRETIGKNLVFISYSGTNGKTQSSRGFLLTSNHLLAPKHIFSINGVKNSSLMEGKLTISRNYDTTKNTSTENVPFDHIKQIGEQDLVIVYLYKCFNVRDRLSLLPQEALEAGSHNFTYFTNDDDGGMTIISAKGTVQTTGYEGARIKGIHSDLHGSVVEAGRCGSLLVSERSSCAIQGFLFSSGSKDSGFEILDRKRIDTVISDFKKNLLDHRACGSDVPLAVTYDGITYPTLDNVSIHDKAKPHFPEGKCNTVHAHGSTKQRFNNKSNIRPRMVAKSVEEIFSVQNEFGPPMFNGIYNGKKVNPSTAYNLALEHLHEGADNVPSVALEAAVKDYKDPLIKEIEPMRPLTDFEVVNGRRDTLYIRRLNMRTSMGFPLFASKDKYFDFNDDTQTWHMGQCVNELYHLALNKVKSGERTYPVFSALLKDEAVTTKKYKVRVFYACPVIFTMLTRKFYLPIAEFLMKKRKLSEIAIGMNAAGPEWDTLVDKHCKKFMGKDRQLFGFDYSKYDLKFSPNVMRAAYLILIDMAEAAGYDDVSLVAMRTIALDACNPFIDWNGTLISVTSMHPSGNALTAVLNTIVNMLLVRTYYYQYNVGNDFRSDVALLGYGDDALGSVKESVRGDFNYEGYKLWLSTINMKITPPWKEDSDIVGFPEDKMDFLKRLSVFHPRLGHSTGAIEEASIFKSLLWGMQLKKCDASGVPTHNTEESVTTSVIDCALHEWALHGEAVYEKRRKQIHELLQRYPDISCDSVEASYEDRIVHMTNGKLIRNGDEEED